MVIDLTEVALTLAWIVVLSRIRRDSPEPKKRNHQENHLWPPNHALIALQLSSKLRLLGQNQVLRFCMPKHSMDPLEHIPVLSKTCEEPTF